jgi:EmrB/QacA subfamily drug resistance transporter
VSADRRSHPRAILIICCVAQFMVVLDVTIVNVALPSIRDALHLSPAGQQWIINAYVLVFGGFLLLGGRAGDLFGRRRVFLFGLSLFGVASLAGGLATSGTTLVLARAVQGLGAAVLAPATLSLLTTTFDEGPARTRALTAWSTTAATGGAFGVVLGGLLTTALSWRWVLFVNVPIGATLLAASAHYLAATPERTVKRNLDLPGSVTITAGLAVLIYAIVTTDRHPWGSLHTLGLIAVALVLLGSFAAIETRSREPLVPLRIFRSRALAGADMIAFLFGGLITAQLFFWSLYLQQADHYTPLHAGVALLLPSSAALVSSLLSGRIVGRVGPRAILIVGPLFAAGGGLWIAQLRAGDSFLVHFGLPAIVCVMGSACCFVPMTMCATAGVAPAEAGLASGLLNSSRQIGAALFLAILATVATSHTSALLRGSGPHPSRAEALTSGFDRGLLLTAVLSLVIVIVAATVLPKLPPRGSPVAAREPGDDVSSTGAEVGLRVESV